MTRPTIVAAGTTGNLGGRIALALRQQDASVRALVRPDTGKDGIARLQALGVTIACVDLSRAELGKKALEVRAGAKERIWT